MKATSIKQAWEMADQIITSDYMYDGWRSERAGYPVYYSTKEGCNEYICDLGDRLEVNLDDGRSVNVWIEKPEYSEYQIEDALALINDTLYEIDDKVDHKLAKAVGIAAARELLYSGYAKITAILERDYPESHLIKKYNLKDC